MQRVNKIKEGRPHAIDLLRDSQIDIVINTPLGRQSFRDDMLMRRECHALGILLLTTISAARATLEAIKSMRQQALEPVALQDWHEPWVEKRAGATVDHMVTTARAVPIEAPL